MIRKISITLILIAFAQVIFSQSPYYLEKSPEKGEGIFALLRRYKLDDNACNLSKFLELNDLTKKSQLNLDKKYKLPILIYEYNGKSIRSSIDNNDYDLALRIKDYNEQILKIGLRKTHFADSKILWVPHGILNCTDNISEVEEIIEKKVLKTVEEDLFGAENKTVEVIDENLKNRVFYIVSGHGGPDPGARYIKGNVILCEDEYAYDVSLRLAKNLIMHSATVYIIIKDTNDGIRDDKYLKCDKDERSYNDKKLPSNQRERLKQRTDDVNKLYKHHKKQGVKSQVLISIHVDSRSYNKRQDVFFYYFSGSNSGKKTALSIHNTFKDKYRKVQKGRAYHGSVTSRNLYILENTLPTAVFIELGNIKNTYNQQRFIIADNRQALANWIYTGLEAAVLK